MPVPDLYKRNKSRSKDRPNPADPTPPSPSLHSHATPTPETHPCCYRTHEHTCQHTDSGLKATLCDHHDSHLFQRQNPYILYGYRRDYSTKQCFTSIFGWHNETMNIWSHIIATILCLGCVGYAWGNDYIGFNADFLDTVIFVGACFGACTCFITSTVYHTFNCHCSDCWRFCIKLDYTGINTIIMSCICTGVHFGYYQHERWQAFYIITALTLASVTYSLDLLHWLNISLISRNAEHKLRIGVFALLTMSGLVPLVHWVQIHGYDSLIVQQFLGHMLGAYTVIGIGFVLYLFRIPERFSPGTFDFLLASHQWWHILVGVGPLWLVWLTLQMIEFKRLYPVVNN